MFGRVLTVVTVAAVITSAVSAQDVKWPKNYFGRYHALAIGKNDYRHLPKLITVVADSETVAPGPPSVHQCDRLAASPSDPKRVGEGVAFGEVEPESAIVACRSAVREFPGVPRFQGQLGRALLRGGNYQEAAAWLRKAAAQGNAIAQNNLGHMYETGRGVAQDHRKTVRLYREAAEQGIAVAQDNLGRMYGNGLGVAQDDHEAVRWYRKAAEQGNAGAQARLAFMYEKGRGVAQDDRESLAWNRKAAEQGNALGQYNLGIMYLKGRGVEKDDREAMGWFRKAAEQGNARAQNSIGWMYANGRGVRKDRNEAVKWYRKAAEQGHKLAQKNLRYLLKGY